MSNFRTQMQGAFIVVLAFFTNGAAAHEFWIDPQDATVAVGDTIIGDLRVGENMKGSGNIYNPNSFTTFAAMTPEGVRKIEGRLGDRPALNLETNAEGLHIVAHMTTARQLTYEKFEKFEAFARAHGQAFAIESHKEKGLPQSGFKEAYYRCAKALISVGSGTGDDVVAGLPFELVALDNPYTTSGPIRLQLLYKRAPMPDHQVDIFVKDDSALAATMMSKTTDRNGQIILERNAGSYMVNAVVIEEPSQKIADELGAVWVSLWASTTFAIE